MHLSNYCFPFIWNTKRAINRFNITSPANLCYSKLVVGRGGRALHFELSQNFL